MKSHAHQLLAFVHVMREGSFSAAAQKMNVTQSALSQHVRKLEQQVGARLLIRGSKGLELTRVGAEMFELAERFASLTHEIDERLTGYSKFDTGHLDIVANAPQPALAEIARYGTGFPNVEISFSLLDWTRTMARLAEHTVDLAFITRPRFLQDCAYKKLSETRYVLYVPQEHRWAASPELSLAELTTETLILPEKGSLTQRVVTKALTEGGITPRRQLITTTFPVMKEAILHGIGVGVFLAEAAAPHDGLAQVQIKELTEPFEIYAAVPKHKTSLRLVRSFWDSLQEHRP